jgi:histidyl-tRNA synthetase
MRILDSKLPEDRAVSAEAPQLSHYASEASKERCVRPLHSLYLIRARFAQVLGGLQALGIAFTVDNQLVRGLDY